MDEPVHCSRCNTVFSSKVQLNEHIVCCSSSFDLTRVKTEIDDSEQEVGTPAETSAAEVLQKNTKVNVAINEFNIANVKTEVKSEIPDTPEATHSDATLKSITSTELAVINQGNGNVPEHRVSEKRGTVHGSQERGASVTGKIQGELQNLPLLSPENGRKFSKILPMPSAIFHIDPGLNRGSSLQSRSLPNILPKIDCNSKKNEGAGLKIDSVFYTQVNHKNMNVVKFMKSDKNRASKSPSSNRASKCPSSTAAKTTCVLPNTFSLNTLAGTGGMPALTGQNMNILPFTPFMLSNNILSNNQQDPLILKDSTPLLNPLPNVNALQTTGLVPGIPTLNLSQSLPNFQNLNTSPNQNSALGVQQNIPQVFSSGTHSSPVFTSDTNQAVGSMMTTAVSSSQQVLYKVPVLVGNQLLLMDMPVQYPTGVSLASTPTSISLTPIIQPPHLLSSTVTQQTVASTVSTPRPDMSVSGSGIHLQSALPTTTCSISPKQLQSPKVTRIVIGAKGKKKTLKSPPHLVLVVSSASQLHPQTETKLLSTNINKEVCSERNIPETKPRSSSTELSATQNVENQTTGTQAEEPNDIPLILNAFTLNDSKLTNKSSVTSKILDQKIETQIDQKTGAQLHLNKTLKNNSLVSGSHITTLKADIVPSLITSSVNQPIMSTDVNNCALISPHGPLLHTPNINIQNILQHSSVSTVIQQPPVLISQFPANDQLLQGSISVVNNNTINMGGNPRLYLSNTLNLPSPDFTMHKKDQVVNESGNNQQHLFQNTQLSEPNVNTHTANQDTTTATYTLVPAVTQKACSPRHKAIKVSAFPLPSSSKKLAKKKVMLITMETPDTMGRRTSLSDKGENLHLEVSSDSSENTISQSFAESLKEPKTVKEMLQTNDIIRQLKPVRIVASTNPVQHAGNKCLTMAAQNAKKLRLFKFQQNHERKSGRIKFVLKRCGKLSSAQPPPDTKTRLQNMQCNNSVPQGDNNSANTCTDSSVISQSNDDAICRVSEVKSICKVSEVKSKVSEVKSIAELIPQHEPLTLFFDANKSKDGKNPVGTLFVGPLTKQQLDKIIQNPSELGKYVSVPSGNIHFSKAIAVPAATSTCTIPTMSKSTVVPQATSTFSPVPSNIVFGQPSFIKIQPKPVSQTVQPPFQTVSITNNRINDLTYFPPSNVPVTSTILSETPNPVVESVQRLGTEAKGTVETNIKKQDIKKSNETCDTTPRTAKSQKFLSEQRRSELKSEKNDDSQNNEKNDDSQNNEKNDDSQKNDVMKLSFVGDLQLLKDCLRKSTVPLKILDIDPEAIADAVGHYNSRVKHKHANSKIDWSKNNKDDDYKPKLKKRKLHDYKQSKTVWTRHKEKELGEHAQKHWVPVEVVGDLAVRGKLLESELVNEEISDGGSQRRSNRISAKPRLDYADLESLPFKDLDEELEDSDFELDSSHSPYTTDLSSPPLLSSAIEQLQQEDIVENNIYIDSPPEMMDMEIESTDDTILSAITTTDDTILSALPTQCTKDNDCVSQEDTEDVYYSSESESDMFDSNDQSLTKADKKKMMWKHHSEITMFLVKHAGKFHSDDDASEHYCSICNKYKTNGIFCLSNHLKRHLSGSLKCSQCQYEACHEQNLAEHGKTHK